MTPLEFKLLIYLCSLIHEEDDFYTYSVSVADIAKVLGRKVENLYEDLIELALAIMRRPVVFRHLVLFEGDSPRQRAVGWFDYFDYIPGEGRIEVAFRPFLKPYLLGLKSEFTRIAVQDVVKLKSFYSFKLYSLLNQYRKIGHRKFTLPELRFSLGIEKREYVVWGIFKRDVLDKAIKELKNLDLLEVETILHKQGRKVAEVEFRFYKPGQAERDVTPTAEEQARMNRRMEHFARWKEIRQGLQGELGFDPDEEQEELDKQADEALEQALRATI